MKDLLQSGKSATMLPSITASSSGHWNHDGVAQVAALDAAVLADAEPASTSPRKPSTSPRPSPAVTGRHATVERTLRELPQDFHDQRKALLHLENSDPDTGVDVALLTHRRTRS